MAALGGLCGAQPPGSPQRCSLEGEPCPPGPRPSLPSHLGGLGDRSLSLIESCRDSDRLPLSDWGVQEKSSVLPVNLQAAAGGMGEQPTLRGAGTGADCSQGRLGARRLWVALGEPQGR